MKRALRAAVLCLVALAAVRAAAAAELTLRAGDGRRLESLPLERLEDDSDELYVSANALARVLQLERFWKPETRKLVLKTADRRIQVTVDTRLVLNGDADALLRVPVRYRRSSVMLPLEFVERILVPALGDVRFDRQTLELRTQSPSSDVAGVDYETDGAATLLRVRLRQARRYRVQATSRDLVRLTLSGAVVDPLALAADQPTAGIRSVRAEQSGETGVLYFEVQSGIERVQDRTEDGGRTILVTVHHPAASVPAARPGPAPDLPRMASAPDSFDLVVLDAGHGGFDRGVQGSGLVEKDVNLWLVQQVQPLLQNDLGVRVLLARSDDQTMAVERRAEIANVARADLFVSLHCNAWYDAGARGFEVFHAPPPAAGTVAPAGIDFVPWSQAQGPAAPRSQAFAEALQAELGRLLPSPNRGAKPADVELLRGLTMPAVLIEVGFLTHAGEAAQLMQPEFAAALAGGIAAAVRRWRGPLGPASTPGGAGANP
jgi:N-acetylmuramoyl-L-alanine amidase